MAGGNWWAAFKQPFAISPGQGALNLVNTMAVMFFLRNLFGSSSVGSREINGHCMSVYRNYQLHTKKWGPDNDFKKILIDHCGAVDDGNSLIVDLEKFKARDNTRKVVS